MTCTVHMHAVRVRMFFCSSFDCDGICGLRQSQEVASCCTPALVSGGGCNSCTQLCAEVILCCAARTRAVRPTGCFVHSSCWGDCIGRWTPGHHPPRQAKLPFFQTLHWGMVATDWLISLPPMLNGAAVDVVRHRSCCGRGSTRMLCCRTRPSRKDWTIDMAACTGVLQAHS